jgi:hypothetical protein
MMRIKTNHLLALLTTLALLLPLLGLGCSDNKLLTMGDDPIVVPDPPGDDDVADDDDAVADDDDGAPYDEEPPQWLDDCPPEAIQATDFFAPDGGDEIYVLANGHTEDTGTLVASPAGVYAVYDTFVYESGASQINESGYLRIRNEVNTDGLPLWGNCGDEYIVQDGDNDGSAPAPLIYLGSFELVEGYNELTLHHFCPLFRQGLCEGFHIGETQGDSSCLGNNVNSLHLVAGGICLIPR